MDKEKVVNLIDELVEMSGVKSDGEARKLELGEVVKKIANIKKIADLKANSGQYFNEVDKLRDVQIKVQYQEEIRKIQDQLAAMQEELNHSKAEEDDLNKQIYSITESLSPESLSSELIAEATKKSSEATEPKNKGRYDKIIAREQVSSKKNEEDLNDLKTKYNSIQDNIKKICGEIDKLNNTLSIYEQNLKVICEKLEDDENYVDKKRRQEDENKKANLERQIADLEKRQSDIISDPVVLGGQAKDALLSGDSLTALNKVREIVRQVSKLPFMKIADDKKLAKIDADATNARDDFYNNNKGKKYKLSFGAIDERIAFLKKCISKWEEEISKYKAEVASIDKDEKYEVTSKISGIQEEITTFETNIADYEEKIKSLDDTDAKKVELQAALNRKENQLNIYKKILDAYKATELSSIKEINQFAQMISELENKITTANSEITTLENDKLKIDSKSADVLAKEADAAELRRLSDVVMAIKHRRKFTKTPEENQTMIEQELGYNVTLESAEKVVVDEPVLSEATEPILSEDTVADLSVVDNNVKEDTIDNVEFKPAFTNEADKTIEPADDVVAEIEINPADLLADTNIELTNLNSEPQVNANPEPETVTDEISIDNAINAISAQLENPTPVSTEAVPEQEANSDVLASTETTNLSDLFNPIEPEKTEAPIPEAQPRVESVVEAPVPEAQPQVESVVEAPVPEAQPQVESVVEAPVPEAQPQVESVVEAPVPEAQPQVESVVEAPVPEAQPQVESAIVEPVPEAQRVVGQEEVAVDASKENIENTPVVENEVPQAIESANPTESTDNVVDFDWTNFFDNLDQNMSAEQEIIANNEEAKELKKVG